MKKFEIRNSKFQKVWRFIFIFGILFGGSWALSTPIHAQWLRYPIAELGNCRNEQECHLYCQIPANTPACWSYGKYVKPAVLGDDTSLEEEANRAKIQFPIAELGNCQSARECFNYCTKPENQTACIEFGQKQGLVKKKLNEPSHPPGIMEAAKTELGCDGKDACRAFCSTPANISTCQAFAQKYNLIKPTPSGGVRQHNIPQQALENAKTELGCTDAESCAALCTQTENKGKCKAFTQKYRHLFTERKGPQSQEGSPSGQKRPVKPCASEEECRTYCESHPDECRGFSGTIQNAPNITGQFFDKRPSGPVPSGQRENGNRFKETGQTKDRSSFIGPSGCKTEAECKAYCESHPDECPGFPKKQENKGQYPSPKYPEGSYPSPNVQQQYQYQYQSEQKPPTGEQYPQQQEQFEKEYKEYEEFKEP